jgi:ParB family transcriptional regulator, chromosome partitioning protein
MSNKRGQWITRRGQADVAAAIDQVIDQQPRPGEHVHQVPDELIEDSPYQARQPFSDESVEELAQGMREVGFQGVLVVRPHGDAAKRRQGMLQLVYGHRRRVAWRRVCAERAAPRVLPVVVREITDQRMLTIGAQENLQRADLTPLEEAQIVAWHEKTFYPASQTVIGGMLGKSESWVKARSRIHRLPDASRTGFASAPAPSVKSWSLAYCTNTNPWLR